MKLEDGMMLFHGSYTIVERIDLSLCALAKDFGRGFYLTSDLQQARSFVNSAVLKAKRHGIIPIDQNYGYITSFRFQNNSDDLKTYEFPVADQQWLWFIANNRRARLFDRTKIHFQDVSESDIIIGKVANDQTNPVITAYLNGLFGDIQSEEAIQSAIRRLMPEHLVDQYCFLTEKAIRCLKFQEGRKYVG